MNAPSGSGREAQAPAIGRDGFAVVDDLVVTNERPHRDPRVVADLVRTPMCAPAPMTAPAQMCACGSMRASGPMTASDSIHAPRPTRTPPRSERRVRRKRRSPRAPTVDLRAVRDESSTIDVLAITQRLAVVVLDVDVVLSHDPLRSAFGYADMSDNGWGMLFIPSNGSSSPLPLSVSSISRDRPRAVVRRCVVPLFSHVEPTAAAGLTAACGSVGFRADAVARAHAADPPGARRIRGQPGARHGREIRTRVVRGGPAVRRRA